MDLSSLFLSLFLVRCYSLFGSFTDDVTNDGSSRMNSEVYRNILSAIVQENAYIINGRHLTMQQDNDPKYIANATKELIRGK